MPIYEYKCDHCGEIFDAMRPFRDADQPIQCKSCQSDATHRKLSSFFAQSSGKQIAGCQSSSSCSGCHGGSCSGCHH